MLYQKSNSAKAFFWLCIQLRPALFSSLQVLPVFFYGYLKVFAVLISWSINESWWIILWYVWIRWIRCADLKYFFFSYIKSTFEVEMRHLEDKTKNFVRSDKCSVSMKCLNIQINLDKIVERKIFYRTSTYDSIEEIMAFIWYKTQINK